MGAHDLSGLPLFTADGETFDQELDGERLGSQQQRIARLMADGKWRTADEVAAALRIKLQASTTTRIRDLRKDRHGRHTVEARRRGNPKDGLWEYRVTKGGGAHV